jgi:hypothetical protein
MADARLSVLLSAQDQLSGVLKGVGSELGMLDNKFSAAKAGERFGETLGGISKMAAGFALGGLGLNLGMGLAEQFKEILTDTVDLSSSTRRLQMDIGGTTESVSALLAVFGRFGVEDKDAENTLTRFVRGMRGDLTASESAANNENSFSGILKEIGVQSQDANGNLRPLNDVLLDTADAFKQHAGDGQNAARAVTLFGKSGKELMPVLALGRDGILELEAEAKKLGLTLTTENVTGIRAFVKEQKTMGESIEGLKIQLGVGLMPLFTELAGAGADWAKTLNADGGKAVRQFGSEIASLVKQLADFKQAFADADALVRNFKPGQAGVDAHDAIARKAEELKANAAALTDWSDKSSAKKPAADMSGLNFNVGALYSGASLAGMAADKADRQDAMAAAKAKAEAEAAGGLADITLAKQKKDLDDQIAAGEREKAILQQNITLKTRESLDLKRDEAELQLSLLPLKAQQADIDQQLLMMADKRAGLERDAAVTRAQMNANNASDALESANFEERRLKLKIQADALGGRGVAAADIAQLQKIALSKPNLELADLNAGRPVTMAERDRTRAQQAQDLATLPLREQKAAIEESTASLTAQSAAVQREIERQRNQGTVDTTGLQKQKQALDDALFVANQKKNDLADKGIVLNLTQNINSSGEIDYDKVLTLTYQGVLDGLTQAQKSVDRPAPAFSPGSRGAGQTGPF